MGGVGQRVYGRASAHDAAITNILLPGPPLMEPACRDLRAPPQAILMCASHGHGPTSRPPHSSLDRHDAAKSLTSL